jgi:hypothetical protein
MLCICFPKNYDAKNIPATSSAKMEPVNRCRVLLAVAAFLVCAGSGGEGMEVIWEGEDGRHGAAAGGADGGETPSGATAHTGMRPVTGVCGMVWRRARPEQLERINDKIWMMVDGLQKDPTDVNLYSQFETACKDNGDHNTRLRLLATIMRLADYDELRQMVMLNQGYALGDRLFGHAKACRFAERDSDFAIWTRMWSSGRWDAMMAAGHALPVLPFYALVFSFNMTQVKHVSVAWALKFGSYTLREQLPSPYPQTYLREFVGAAPSRRLKIGYISSDVYRVHPVGKSINACMRMHDPAHIEVYAFLLVGSQIEEAAELEEGTGGVMLSDISILSSAEGALAVNEEGIHILIDLNGHTQGVRMELLAYNPAPIIMHYMGFGATTGASYIHYFLGDTAVAPPELAPYYTEKMAYLSASFYVNSYRVDTDRMPFVGRGVWSEEDFCGARRNNSLPESGVVLCNFNHLHKTSRAQWAVWGEILKNSGPDTVLWTLNDNPETQTNIAHELAFHGVDEAAKMRYASHEKIR